MTRTWQLTAEGERPMTVNRLATLHRMQWANHTRTTRHHWSLLARNIPKINAATLIAQPLHKDRRSPQDVAACAPEVKAAVDGIIDAGVLTDDSPQYLRAITFLPPDICGVDGLRVTILEEAE